MIPKLAETLDKFIANYKPEIVRKVSIGTPKLTEADLRDIISRSPDLSWNKDGMYYIMNVNYDIANIGSELLPDKKFIIQTGKFYYPPGGFMGWHTNSGTEGYRVYATYCKEGEKSFFRYFLDGKIHTEWEQKGWNCRMFEVRKDSLYWHCVWSDTDRYSFGFRYAF